MIYKKFIKYFNPWNLRTLYVFYLHDYSYLPNKRGDPNKQGGLQNSPKGESGIIILLHKYSC